MVDILYEIFNSSPFREREHITTVIRVANLQDTLNITSIIYQKAPNLDYGEKDEVLRWLNDYHAEQHTTQQIISSDYVTFVAEVDGCFAGTAYINIQTGYLGGLYTNITRQGVASELIKTNELIADEYKLPYITMSIYENNHKMLNLATKHNYVYAHDDPDKSYFPETIFHILQKVL